MLFIFEGILRKIYGGVVSWSSVFVGRTVRSGVGVALRSGGEVVLGSRVSGSKVLALRYAQEVKLLGSLGRTLRSFRNASAWDS